MYTNEKILNQIDISLACNNMTVSLINMINNLIKTYLNATPSLKYDTYIKYKYNELCKKELYKKWNYYNPSKFNPNKSNTTPISYYMNYTQTKDLCVSTPQAQCNHSL